MIDLLNVPITIFGMILYEIVFMIYAYYMYLLHSRVTFGINIFCIHTWWIHLRMVGLYGNLGLVPSCVKFNGFGVWRHSRQAWLAYKGSYLMYRPFID